jgi:uncharacterized membrane protein YeaQ/YmgE (transglycosylase-associated protein family)
MKKTGALVFKRLRLTFAEGRTKWGPAARGRVHPREIREAGIMSGLIWWIVVGLIAGWLAGKVMKGGGYGVLVDIVLGILGAIVGGWVFGLLHISIGSGLIGSILVAFVGAVILVWITRLLKKA